MGIQMVTGPRAIQNTQPLLIFPVEPEISTPEKSAFCNEHFRTISNVHCRARSDNMKKKMP